MWGAEVDWEPADWPPHGEAAMKARFNNTYAPLVNSGTPPARERVTAHETSLTVHKIQTCVAIGHFAPPYAMRYHHTLNRHAFKSLWSTPFSIIDASSRARVSARNAAIRSSFIWCTNAYAAVVSVRPHAAAQHGCPTRAVFLENVK